MDAPFDRPSRRQSQVTIETYDTFRTLCSCISTGNTGVGSGEAGRLAGCLASGDGKGDDTVTDLPLPRKGENLGEEGAGTLGRPHSADLGYCMEYVLRMEPTKIKIKNKNKTAMGPAVPGSPHNMSTPDIPRHTKMKLEKEKKYTYPVPSLYRWTPNA